MTKRRHQQKASAGEEPTPTPTSNYDFPLWVWALIFFLPLIASELMFYNVGRTLSMILFPLAWIGFWVAMMSRAGWPILEQFKKDRDDKENSKE